MLKDKLARQEIEYLENRTKDHATRINLLEAKFRFHDPRKPRSMANIINSTSPWVALIDPSYKPKPPLNATLDAQEIIKRFEELYKYLGVSRRLIPATKEQTVLAGDGPERIEDLFVILDEPLPEGMGEVVKPKRRRRKTAKKNGARN